MKSRHVNTDEIYERKTKLADLLPITTEDMIAELERELVLRRRVYPMFVSNRRLSQDKADRQCEIIKAIIDRLKAEPKPHAFVSRGGEFCEVCGHSILGHE